MNQIPRMLIVMSIALLAAPPALSANPEDEKAIRDAAAKYAEAFNKGDVDAMVAQYAKDATYDAGEGPVIAGRDEIRKELAANIAESKGTKMSIDIKSIRFTKLRAIEIGVATMTSAGGESTAVPYRAIHTRQPDGKWLITNVGPDTTAEGAEGGPLDELDWMLGRWQDSEADIDLRSECRWDRNRRFMIRTFAVQEENRSVLEVTEIIGWDAADRVIRSWVFDSDGGFGHSTWSRRGDEWIILARGALADGGRGSAVNIIRRLDQNSFAWSSTNRDVDGQMLPDVTDVKMVRVPETQAASGGSMP
ncbi:MAG: hypothetical protein DCC65_15030 [Planctomycetota bacterium]|nr:MAG: hypothetical protein DCC65_15030 [Planctomycetota bacterium]